MINKEQFNIGQLLNSKDTSSIDLGIELCRTLNYPLIETYFSYQFPNSIKNDKIKFNSYIYCYEQKIYDGVCYCSLFFHQKDYSYFGIPLLWDNIEYGIYDCINESFYQNYYNDNFNKCPPLPIKLQVSDLRCIFTKESILLWFNNQITEEELINQVYLIQLHIKTENEDFVWNLDKQDINLYKEYVNVNSKHECIDYDKNNLINPVDIGILSAIKGISKAEKENNWKGCKQLRDILIKLTNENNNNGI